MKPEDYDKRIGTAVKAIRLLRNEKQDNIAKCLRRNQSEYSRIENGERSISLGQLKCIANNLRVSIDQIIAIAEADIEINFKSAPMILIINKLQEVSLNVQLTEFYSNEQLEFIAKQFKTFPKHHKVK